MLTTLSAIYLPLLGWTLLGYTIQRVTPTPLLYRLGIHRIGRFMFWIGVPVSIIGFMQGIDLGEAAWLSPVASWVAIGLSVGLAHIWIGGWRWLQLTSAPGLAPQPVWTSQQQGSFRLSAAMGNTGYMGFPICLAIGGPTFFAWAVLYDLLGSLLGTYGLGVWLASRYGARQIGSRQALVQVLRTPALWAVGLGLLLNQSNLPSWLQQGLNGFAWSMIPVSLALLGMRLGQAQIGRSLARAGVALVIKLLIVPCLIALLLIPLPLPAMGKLILVLQSGMPPAISTLVLTEEFELDRDLTVTALAVGYGLALLTLPLWIGFSQSTQAMLK